MSSSIKDAQVSLRLPAELKDRMETYAALTGRSRSYVAMEALSTYLEARIPQIEDLRAAVQAADQGEFASDDEVAAALGRHTARPAARSAATKPARRQRSK